MIEFNNREIASFIVFVLFILFAVYKSKDRKKILSSFLSLIKIFFSKQIFITVILFVIYMYSEISFLYKVNFIDSSMLKESIIWSLGAFGLIMKHQDIVKEEKFVRKLIFDNLKLLALFEFIYNIYSFNLAIEIVLVFVITILVMMKIVIGDEGLNEGEDLLVKIIDFILSLIVIATIIFTIIQLYSNYNEINVIQNTKSLFLPLVLIIFYIPFYYLLLLYAKYEMVFITVGFFTKENKEINSYLKRKVFLNAFINYSKLKKIHTRLFEFQGCKTRQEVDNIWNELY